MQDQEHRRGRWRTVQTGLLMVAGSVVAKCTLRYSLLLLPLFWTHSCAAPLFLELLSYPGLKPVLTLSKRSIFTGEMEVPQIEDKLFRKSAQLLCLASSLKCTDFDLCWEGCNHFIFIKIHRQVTPSSQPLPFSPLWVSYLLSCHLFPVSKAQGLCSSSSLGSTEWSIRAKPTITWW